MNPLLNDEILEKARKSFMEGLEIIFNAKVEDPASVSAYLRLSLLLALFSDNPKPPCSYSVEIEK